MPRPIETYSLGIHHLAQPTIDPEATLDFYVETMGARITHCIASKGWRPGHRDYIHMFLDLGKDEGGKSYPDNIAMFYYFGVKDPSEWPKYGTHHSFAANSIEELDAWQAWLTEKGHKILWRAQYEIMTSIYLWDPNGRILEIAAQHRPLNVVDADDAQLTAQALVLAAKEHAVSIEPMWGHKARLLEKRDGAIADVALVCPNVEEFAPLVAAARTAGGEARERGNFTLVEADSSLRITRPDELPEAVWWGAGTGGIKGRLAALDEDQLLIEPPETSS